MAQRSIFYGLFSAEVQKQCSLCLPFLVCFRVAVARGVFFTRYFRHPKISGDILVQLKNKIWKIKISSLNPVGQTS